MHWDEIFIGSKLIKVILNFIKHTQPEYSSTGALLLPISKNLIFD